MNEIAKNIIFQAMVTSFAGAILFWLIQVAFRKRIDKNRLVKRAMWWGIYGLVIGSLQQAGCSILSIILVGMIFGAIAETWGFMI